LQIDQKSWWQSIGDAYRIVTIVTIAFLLTIIVADVYTYAYAAHYLALSIVLRHSQPTLRTLEVAAASVIVFNVALELVGRFSDIAILGRVMRHGTFVGFSSFERPWRVAIVIVAAYLVVPAIGGKVVSATQTSYQVVKLSEPERAMKEAIIVSPTVNGVLLALYDRTRNAVIANEMLLDTLAPGEPRYSQSETLGHVIKQ
jgi:hypothetical protein